MTNAKGPRGGGPGSKAMRPVEKASNFRGTFLRLLKYLAPFRKQIALVLVLAVVASLFTVLSPRVLGLAMNKLLEGLEAKKLGGSIDFKYIAKILTILGGLYLVSAIFAYLQRNIMASVSQGVVFNLREEVDEKLSKLPLRYYDANQTGNILSRVTNDVDSLSSTIQRTLTQFITSIITVIGVLLMMLSIDIKLTLITFLVIPTGIFATKSIAKKSQKYFKGQSQSLGNLNGHIEEMYSGHEILKVFSREEESLERFNKINDELYKKSYKAQFISGIMRPVMNFIDNLSYIVVAVIGGGLVLQGKISIGEIQAFIQYSREFTQPIVRAADIINDIQSSIASAERVFQVLDEEEERPYGHLKIDKESFEGRVDFKDVNFSYDKSEELIKDMNLSVNPGDTIAIVGPTGAGKTTLVNLLMRFYDVDSGEILIDGVNINDIEESSLRDLFAMVLQDTWLFKGSIKENIAYGSKNVGFPEVIEAAKIAQADFFIRTLPDGYDTILSEDADTISKGQKQLLTIARAIIKDPKIIILDEATSSVDTRTELLIQRAMDKVMENRTSFVIAHRLSTIKNADTILVVNDGRIIQKGSHSELMAQDGFYKELYNSQFAA